VVIVLAIVFFLYLVRGILFPFLMSFVIAAILEPTVRRLRLRGMSRRSAVTLVTAGFFLLSIGLLVGLMPSIVSQSGTMRTEVSKILEGLTKEDPNENFYVRWRAPVLAEAPEQASQIDRLLSPYSRTLARFGLPSTQREIMSQYIEPERPKIAAAVQESVLGFFGLFSSFFSHLLFLILIPILVPLILMEYDDFKKTTPRWIPPALRQSAMSVMSDIGQVFFKYLRGISLVVGLYTLAQLLVLLFFGVPYALLLAPIFGALYLIPYIGNVISAITLFVLIGLSNVSGNFIFHLANPWGYALLVTFVYLIVGWTFDHLIYPQMVGNSVGLSPVISMFVIFAGGALFGLPGMLVAFPLAGSVKVILDRLIRVTSSSNEGLGLPAIPLRHRSSPTG
jgi:predicted PurR-regulated permease PerM